MREQALEMIEERFDPALAEHLTATVQNVVVSEDSPSFQFGEFFDAVISQKVCSHPGRDGWYCVPLHEQGSPALTDQYIVFTKHRLRGKLVLLTDPEGDSQPQSFSPDDFSELALVDRLRFWSPSHYSEGIEQARSFATTTISEVDCQQLPPESETEIERLDKADTGLEYALAVASDLPNVEIATIERQRETITECLKKLKETKRQTQIQSAIEDIRKHIERGDRELDTEEYGEALAAYRVGEKRLEQLRGEFPEYAYSNERVVNISQRLGEKILTATREQQRSVVLELETSAKETEQKAQKIEQRGDHLQARAVYKEAKQAYQRAVKTATDLPEKRIELNATLDRVSDRIEATEAEYYRSEISGTLAAAKRRERLGDELTELGKYKNADYEYNQGLSHVERCLELASEGEMLEEETKSCRETLQQKRETASLLSNRQQVDRLLEKAATLEQAATTETTADSAADKLEEARAALIEARNVTAATDAIEMEPVQKRIQEVSARYRSEHRRQKEQELEAALAPAERQFEAGKEALDAGKPEEAVVSFREAKRSYESVRRSLSERGLATFDVRVKARLSQVESKVETARRECRTRLDSAIDTAEQIVKRAEQHRDDGEYEAAQSTLEDALDKYRDAHRISSRLEVNQVPDILQRVRQAQTEIRSLQAVPAKLALQDCIESARANVRAGHTAQVEGQTVNAREIYGDALYFLEEALDIIADYDLGTTADIERHNRTLLLRNKQRVERARNRLEQEQNNTGSELPNQPVIKDLTEHLHPPDAAVEKGDLSTEADSERQMSVSREKKREHTLNESEKLDIVDELLTELENMSEEWE